MVRTTTDTLLLLEVVNEAGRTVFTRFCIKVEVFREVAMDEDGEFDVTLFRVVAKEAAESIPETAMGTLTSLTLSIVCLRFGAGLTVFGR